MHYGFDGWVTTMAVAEPLQICRAGLGTRIAQPRPTGELSTVVAQAVGCIFHLMERYQETWESITRSVPVSTVGSPMQLGSGSGPINVERMVNAFRQGLRDLLPLWQLILSPETVQRVVELGMAEAEQFYFPPDLWVQVVYDFALAYHDRVVHHEHLLKALTPLYLGHTASFVIQTRPYSAEQVEQELGRLSDHFEKTKPYLVQRWRWQNG
jgi:glucosylglycerate synthase